MDILTFAILRIKSDKEYELKIKHLLIDFQDMIVYSRDIDNRQILYKVKYTKNCYNYKNS